MKTKKRYQRDNDAMTSDIVYLALHYPCIAVLVEKMIDSGASCNDVKIFVKGIEIGVDNDINKGGMK